MRPPTVTFLGGVREIGGNKILIRDGPDRVLFDFGPSFSPKIEQYYVDYLQPRSTSRAKDLLEFGLLPAIDGLYSPDALGEPERRTSEPGVDAVFVSHAHADHAGYLELLHPEIPVHVGRGTRILLEAIESATPMRYGDHPWRPFDDGATVKVGRIEVVPFPVDHSVPFAYGFLVRTSEGTVVYTGDFRHHGPRAAQTHAFFQAAAEERPAALLIEGTRAGPDPRHNLTEEGVRREADRLIADRRELALACTYPRDVDRLTTLARAAHAADRELVVSTRTAHLLSAVAPLFPAGVVPVPGTPGGPQVYRRKKRRFFTWEKPFLDTALDAEAVRARGRDYLLALDLMHFPELIDLRPPNGGVFLHSMSEPFSEDDVDDRVMRNWLDHFGLSFHQLHASGHASGPELLELVDAVAPQELYPIHTEHPEAFRGTRSHLALPELGVEYPVGAGRPGRSAGQA